MDLSLFLAIVSFVCLAMSFYCDGRKSVVMAVLTVVIGCISLTLILTEKKSNEQIMMERIIILEKAKDSTDPTVLAIAQSVKAEIAKEQEQKEQSRIEKEKRDKFLEENPKLPMILLMGMLACLGFLAWGLRD